MEMNNKLLWFFLVICYCITAPSCRTMKSHIDRQKSSFESSIETFSSASYSYLDTSKKDFRELITYDFKFRDFDFPPERNRNIKAENLTQLLQIEGLMNRVTDLQVKIERAEKEQKAVKIDSGSYQSDKSDEKSSNSSTVKNKESDSTWGANVPWYAWVIGAVLIFGIVAYSWKQIRP